MKAAGKGLFVSSKRYELTGPDGKFIDRKESILGMLLPPCAGWIDEAWRTVGEIWDGHRPKWQPWLTLPAVRQLSVTTPAHARQLKGLPGLRPWNLLLVAHAIGRHANGRHANDREPVRAVVVAPFERDPQKWATLDWRFCETGEPVPFDRPDNESMLWRLRTLHDFLLGYARHSISEMLAPDGSRCGPYTRGVLQRRPTRDGERWLILKEAAVWGDDPRNAFSSPEPEKVRAGRSTAAADWETKIKPALAVVGASAVARRMRLAERSGRAWAGGQRQPENPGDVARAIVAVANEVGLALPRDEHMRAEEICSELPPRAAAVQAFIVIAVSMLIERHGGVRALARAISGEYGPDLEPTVRRWLGLGQSEPRSIIELNRIVGRLAKFSLSEIRKMRRRIRRESGPVGDRQIVFAHLSVLIGAEKPVVLTAEETLAFPALLILAGLLAAVADAFRQGRGDKQGNILRT